jgi:DNA gyrase subunit B
MTLEEVKVKIDGVESSNDEIRSVVNKYNNYIKTLMSYDKHYDADILKHIIQTNCINIDNIKDEIKLTNACQELTKHYNNLEAQTGKKYLFSVEPDAKFNAFYVKITIKTVLKTKSFKITKPKMGFRLSEVLGLFLSNIGFPSGLLGTFIHAILP